MKGLPNESLETTRALALGLSIKFRVCARARSREPLFDRYAKPGV